MRGAGTNFPFAGSLETPRDLLFALFSVFFALFSVFAREPTAGEMLRAEPFARAVGCLLDKASSPPFSSEAVVRAGGGLPLSLFRLPLDCDLVNEPLRRPCVDPLALGDVGEGTPEPARKMAGDGLRLVSSVKPPDRPIPSLHPASLRPRDGV